MLSDASLILSSHLKMKVKMGNDNPKSLKINHIHAGWFLCSFLVETNE